MTDWTDWTELNQKNWDERAPAHAASPDYPVERFLADPAFLSEVVRFDVPRLGDVRGLRGVHLQCHIGTDTLSLHRLGARMTGLDFSAPALAQARALAGATGADVDFVESDVYGAPDVLEPGRSTSSTPASARSAGCPTSAGGPGSSPPCCARAAGCSSARGTRCSGRSDRRPGATCCRRRSRTSRPRSRGLGPRPGTYVDDRHAFPNTRPRTGTTGSARSSPPCSTPACGSRCCVEHDSVPWDALPGLMDRRTTRRVPPVRPPGAAAAHLHTPGGEALTGRPDRPNRQRA